MGYKFGTHSRRELIGVHPLVIAVATRAIENTEQDFTVHDGLRTKAEQEEYVRTGVSWTMKSRHLTQEDGHGHAVDLVPYINGRLRWEWDPIYKIFLAVREAADYLDVPLIWGGCWHKVNATSKSPAALRAGYEARKRRQGKKAHPDGPHWQLALPS